MSEDDAARLMNYARRERPELLSKTVKEKPKPWFLKGMGNPVIMGALAVTATKLLGRQNRRRLTFLKALYSLSRSVQKYKTPYSCTSF
jgi:hypothetical protein